jgi:transcriptional regulator with XRE-family HTH domain
VTPQELKDHRTRLGLTVQAMAERLHTPYRTYLKWERGERRVPGMLEVAIEKLMEDAVKDWLKEYIEGCRANNVDPVTPIIEYSNCADAEVTEDGVWSGSAWWDEGKIAAFREWVESL